MGLRRRPRNQPDESSRYAMLATAVDASGRNCPDLRLQVDFVPGRADSLASSRGGQDRKFERPRGDAVALAKQCHKLGKVGEWQRRVVVGLLNLSAGGQHLTKSVLSQSTICCIAATSLTVIFHV
jgi:hypothetical protein